MNCDRHDVLFDGSQPLPSNYRAYRHSVHARLAQILQQNPGRRFLEIGVGPSFRQERFRAIDELDIRYVGWTSNMSARNAEPIWGRRHR